MKKIIIFIFLFFIGFTKMFAFELTTWDNLKFYLYTPKMLFNSSIDLYNKGDYERADFYLDMIKCSPDNNFCAKKYYNKGNINYKLGEQKTDNIEKEFYFKKALENYNESLKYLFDKDTVDNIDIVKKKISELENKNKQQDKKDDKKQQNEQEKQKDNQNEDSSNNNQKNSEKSQENNNQSEKTSTGNIEKENKNGLAKKQEQQVIQNGNMGLGGDKNDTSSLSESDKQELENYYNSLKNEEKQNQKYFNKKNTSNLEENPFDSMLSPFKLFREDSFFGEDFDGGNSDNKKDW